jgi:hypothetical protein
MLLRVRALLSRPPLLTAAVMRIPGRLCQEAWPVRSRLKRLKRLRRLMQPEDKAVYYVINGDFSDKIEL